MKTSQDSFYWSEVADLTHETQVSIFGWCGCEDGEKTYSDCLTNVSGMT
jgi:hypothetical protein